MKKIICKPVFSIIFNLIVISSVFCQTDNKQDTTKAVITTNKTSQKIGADTVVNHEVSPLDISKNRGLFILTRDGKMQLRILGSVRFSAFYDFVELPVKNTFNTYFIPTGADNHKILNYHNSLSQTRIGFEITRITNNRTVFIRIETDFDGPGGQFRIRHAYGQVGGLLVGQTWSLFSNVSDLPTTIDKNGPTGSIAPLNPQIRYNRNYKTFSWAVGLEYSLPDLGQKELDTAGITTVQMIPDISGQIRTHGKLGSIQLSLIMNSISIKDSDNKISNSFGIGASISGKLNITMKQKLYFQLAYGKSIAHYITTFNGAGLDAIYNPDTNKFEGLYSMGGFISYGYNWNPKVSTNLSFGSANIFNIAFQSDNAYRNSCSASIDAFWRVITGARIGLSYSYGQRWNKDGVIGQASRIWALFYYDF